MYKRVVIAFLVILFFMGGLIIRFYDLSGRQLSKAAEQQAGLTVTVANARGTIYDSKLRPLVNKESEYRVSVTPNPQAVAALSACVDNSKLETLTSRLQKGKPVVTTINTMPSPAKGLTLFETPVRYSERLPAPHVIGYMDGDGLHGATGAEFVFDDLLNECEGEATVTYTVDAVGKPLEGIQPTLSNTLSDAKAGVVLTIDKDIQQIAESAAKAHMTKGAVVVMEPSTGRIAAMVSLPDFQPDTIGENLENPDSPLVNRALRNYNCGSVFKIVTATAAIESGIPLSQTFNCNGSIDVVDVTFHCHNRLGHGTLTMPQAFAKSCNPYFIQLGLKTGGQNVYKMATSLGFDRPVFLCEGWKTARGMLPSEAELLSPAAVANISFGQGSLMATPVHIAQLVGSVVNHGNVVRPTLLKGTVDSAGQLKEESPAPKQNVFSSDTADKLHDMMLATVNEGTGKSACPIEGGAGGKTGTAETGWVIDGRSVVQSWFGGFYPAENPEYVIVVLAEDTEGTHGKSSPVFKQICEEINMLKKIQ